MRKTLEHPLLTMEELKMPRFSAKDVAELLAVPNWRLQKFLNSPQFGLSSAGHLIGRGRGSRRTFSRNDLYLIGLAARLVRDGFAAKFIGQVVESLADIRFVEMDEQGNELTLGIVFGRGAKGPKIERFRSDRPPQVGVGAPFY